MPSVDVVIPCYNYAHLLPQCVHSVLDQGIEELRIVIIDNASTDGSVEVARRLAAKDSRIETVCHQENLGPHASFNEGIDLARADYFMILCVDDLLTPGALRHGLALLERFPEASFAMGRPMAPWVGDDAPPVTTPVEGGKLVDGQRLVERCCRKMKFHLPAHAMLVRTSVQKAVGHYRPTVPLLDDMEMALRLACYGSVVELSAPLAILREHTSNISQVMWHDALRRLQEYETVFESFFAHEGRVIPNATALRRAVRRHLAAAAYWSAMSHFFRGKADEGTQLLRYAFALNPRSKLIPPVGHLYRTKGALKRALAVVASRLPLFASRLEGGS